MVRKGSVRRKRRVPCGSKISSQCQPVPWFHIYYGHSCAQAQWPYLTPLVTVACTVRVLSCFSSAVTDGDPVQLFLHSRENVQPNCYNRKTSDTRWLYEIFRSLWIVLYEYTLGVRDHDIVKDSIIQSGWVSFMEAERSLPCDHNQLLSKITWNVLRNNINNNNYYYYHY